MSASNSRKPNCGYHRGTSLQNQIKFENFCRLVNSVLESSSFNLPDSINTGFKTCGDRNGYWRIQEDRRVGRIGNLQICMGKNCCSACYGFANKAFNLTYNYRRNNSRNIERRDNSIRRDRINSIINERMLDELFESISAIDRNLGIDRSLGIVNTYTATNLEENADEDDESHPTNLYDDLDFGDSLPDGFKCPIGLTIMSDPVICSDGHSYERHNIKEWFKRNNKSPKTGLNLDNKMLIPNHSLRSSIEEFVEQFKRSQVSTLEEQTTTTNI